ncbi:U-box domain-containing protein 4-like [Phragmites australis]|uniref:U-box domain-containing protein 4-like n=1 Tax=Phragmites australis TaxID=29695 RepID=UPI002D797552|nr:U-box domain-containing protein 4-like [Phragmites australis]
MKKRSTTPSLSHQRCRKLQKHAEITSNSMTSPPSSRSQFSPVVPTCRHRPTIRTNPSFSKIASAAPADTQRNPRSYQATAMEVKLHTVRTLVGRLRGAAAAQDGAATAAAVAELRLVSKDDPEIRAPLADAGAVPFLVAQLATAASVDAAAALLNISISAREQLMSTPGLLDALTAALRTDAAHHTAATIHSLLCVEAYRATIGAKRPLLAALVSLLRAAPSTRATKDALKALFGVALYPPNRATLVGLGAVQELFALVMTDGRSGIIEDVTAVIAQVAGCAETLEAFRLVSGVRILLDLVEPGGAATARARENAVAALLNLVVAGGEPAVTEVIAVGGAEDAVRELAEDAAASPRGKAKAEALLRALEGAGARRPEHRLADFLNGLVQSDPYISSPASASTHG